jgi:hypothetical protein
MINKFKKIGKNFIMITIFSRAQDRDSMKQFVAMFHQRHGFSSLRHICICESFIFIIRPESSPAKSVRSETPGLHVVKENLIKACYIINWRLCAIPTVSHFIDYPGS